MLNAPDLRLKCRLVQRLDLLKKIETAHLKTTEKWVTLSKFKMIDSTRTRILKSFLESGDIKKRKKNLFGYYEKILGDAKRQKIVKESIVWDSSKIAAEDLRNISYCERGLWALLLERYLENEVKIEEPKESQQTEEEPKAKRRRPTRSTRDPSDLFADRLKEWIEANESDLCEDKPFKITLRKTEESLAQDEIAALDAPSSIAKRGYVSIMADNFCEFSTARRAEKSTEHLVKMFFDDQERAKVQNE